MKSCWSADFTLPSEQMRQARIEHVRLPREASGLRARVLESLVLRLRNATIVKRGVLGSAVRIANLLAQINQRRHREHVHELIHGRCLELIEVKTKITDGFDPRRRES